MKRVFFGSLFSLCLATAALAQAAAQAPAAPAAPKPTTPPVPGTKIALIDMRKAITESEPGRIASAEYAKELSPQTAVLEKLSKEASELQEKLRTAKTDAEKNELTRQLDTKQKEGQRAQEDAQQKSQDLQDKLLPPIAVLVNKALDAYAIENGLAVVLDPTTDPNNIVHFSPGSDITNEIIRRVDAEHAKNPKPAAATTAPATGKPAATTPSK
jgi:Skp family chaperone for outer membrane proteins